MENFLTGLRAVLLGMLDTLAQLADYPLFGGFVVGFLVSTVAHAFLMVDHPRQVPSVLFGDKASSFQRLYPPKPDGSFTKSYSDYSRMADRVKIAFLTAALLVMIVLFIAVITR